MMFTIGSFVSTEVASNIYKNMLNISAISLLREIISSFWVSVILLRLLEILFARKGFIAFQFLVAKETFFFLLKKTDTVISLLFICRFVRLSFIFQKFVT